MDERANGKDATRWKLPAVLFVRRVFTQMLFKIRSVLDISHKSNIFYYRNGKDAQNSSLRTDMHSVFCHGSSSSYPLEIIFRKIPFRTIPENCHHRASILSGALRPTRRGGSQGHSRHTTSRCPPSVVRRPTSSFALLFHRRGGFRGSSSDGAAAPVAADAPRPAAAWRRRGDDIGRRAGPIRCTYLVTGTRHYPWLIIFCDAMRRGEDELDRVSYVGPAPPPKTVGRLIYPYDPT